MRINTVNIVCGGRGTGKSTFFDGSKQHNVRGVIPAYLNGKGIQKVLIVDTFDNPFWQHYPIMNAKNLARWQKGIYRLFGSDIVRTMNTIEANCYNTALVFEDATKFIGSRLTDDVKNFIVDSKQKNLDIFFIFHALMLIPNDLIRFSDTLTLFKTNENFTTNLRSKFPVPNLEQLFNEVNAHPSKYYNQTIRISD